MSTVAPPIPPDPLKQTARIAVMVADGLSPFHLAVPWLVFGEDRAAIGAPGYEVRLCAEGDSAVHLSMGLQVETFGDLAALAGSMAEVSRAQGLLIGRLADVGMALRDQASLTTLTEEVLKTSEIEGERLNAESVRSSIARRLGVDIGALAPVDRNAEGVVEMVLDATLNCEGPLTPERLFGWHGACSPPGMPVWPESGSAPGAMMPAGRCRSYPGRSGGGACISKPRRQIDWRPRRRASLTGSIRLTPPHS